MRAYITTAAVLVLMTYYGTSSLRKYRIRKPASQKNCEDYGWNPLYESVTQPILRVLYRHAKWHFCSDLVLNSRFRQVNESRGATSYN